MLREMTEITADNDERDLMSRHYGWPVGLSLVAVMLDNRVNYLWTDLSECDPDHNFYVVRAPARLRRFSGLPGAIVVASTQCLMRANRFHRKDGVPCSKM